MQQSQNNCHRHSGYCTELYDLHANQGRVKLADLDCAATKSVAALKIRYLMRQDHERVVDRTNDDLRALSDTRVSEVVVTNAPADPIPRLQHRYLQSHQTCCSVHFSWSPF